MKRFWKIKNLVALFLAAVMLVSPAVTALAQGITLNADSTIVNPGDQVKVTVKLDEEITNVTAGEVRVQYDEDLFTFDSNASKPEVDITIKKSTRKRCRIGICSVGAIFVTVVHYLQINCLLPWYLQQSKTLRNKSCQSLQLVYTTWNRWMEQD